MQVPLIGPSYQTIKSKEESNQQLINMYLVQSPVNQTYPLIAYPTPGAKVWSNDVSDSEVRGMHSQNNVLYAVIGGKFYSFDTSGTATERGNLDTDAEPVVIAGIKNQIIITDGVKGYHYNDVTKVFTTLTAGTNGFPEGTKTITAQDSYFIGHLDQAFYISNLNDGTTWTATDFASAEGDPDDLKAVQTFQRRLFLIGEVSTEIWFNSGSSDFTFNRIEGVYIEHGTLAPNSVGIGDNNIFWLAQGKQGQLSIVQVDESYQDTIVSTQALNNELATYKVTSNAIGFTFQREGKEFYQITFPSEDKTWVYDVDMQVWHELRSTVDGTLGRHLANSYASFDGKNLIGDYKSGTIYELDSDTYTDNGAIILRKIVTTPMMSGSRDYYLHRLEIDVENGVGLESGQGVDPQMMLRVSRDGGFSWGNTMYRSAGKLGEYTDRILYNRLGTGRKFVLELTMTDPVKWIILGAWAELDNASE